MSSPRVRFPIGTSDFRTVRADGFVYVDKTALIDDVLTESAQVLLAPRPRRFGKTLNLSMLRYFFEKSAEDRRALFAGLAVASSESAWAHFQRYPVIFMTFKDVKPSTSSPKFLPGQPAKIGPHPEPLSRGKRGSGLRGSSPSPPGRGGPRG